MLPQSKGKMFLADERGLNELSWYRSFNTFNFGGYQHQHKEPFGALYVLNDDTLAAGKEILLNVEEDTDIVLIPIVGSMVYLDSLDNTGVIPPGQAQVLYLFKGSTIRLANPYEDELINFIYLCIKTSPCKSTDAVNFSFDLNAQRNQLLPLFTAVNAKGFIGQFDSREEVVYKIADPAKAVFAFVIDGDFEVQYRLMHPRDGLVLWDMYEVELEALSNNAIIIVIEVTI